MIPLQDLLVLSVGLFILLFAVFLFLILPVIVYWLEKWGILIDPTKKKKKPNGDRR